MTEIFLKLLNMSLTALPLIVAAVLFRFAFKRAPKWARCLMWGLVGLRLVLPFTFESPVGVIPDPEPVKITLRSPAVRTEDGYIVSPARQGQEVRTEPAQIRSDPSAGADLVSVPAKTADRDVTAVPAPLAADADRLPTAADRTAIPASAEAAAETEEAEGALPVFTKWAAIVWAAGAAVMLGYSLASYIRLRLRVRFGIRTEDKVFECEEIDTPFILGVFRPRIYIPYSIEKGDAKYVIAHERAHLSRRDNLWKPLGFVLLSVYWFNPAMWAAYAFLCRDIELACDERVINEMGEEAKAAYSRALVNCSMPRRSVSACPLAFGELAVKERVKTVLNYKKPAFWVIIAAVLACAITATCLLTTRAKEPEPVVYDVSLYDGLIDDYAKVVMDYTSGMDYEEQDKLIEGREDLGAILYSIRATKDYIGRDAENYGFATKDINNDGTQELFIISGEYDILAVFTINDGKPALLESFSTRHGASLGEDGKIYTEGSESGFASHKEALELKNGELKETVHIKYEAAHADGMTDKIYLVDGEKEKEISEEKEEELTADWPPVTNVYTAAHGGLKFIHIADYMPVKADYYRINKNGWAMTNEKYAPENKPYTVFKISGRDVYVKDEDGAEKHYVCGREELTADNFDRLFDGYEDEGHFDPAYFRKRIKYARIFRDDSGNTRYLLYVNDVIVYMIAGKSDDGSGREVFYAVYDLEELTHSLQYEDGKVVIDINTSRTWMQREHPAMEPVDYDTFPEGRSDWDKIWEDYRYDYYYPNADYGEITVYYADESCMDVVEALYKGYIGFADLDEYQIPYMKVDRLNGGARESRVSDSHIRYQLRYTDRPVENAPVKTMRGFEQDEGYKDLISSGKISVTPLEETAVRLPAGDQDQAELDWIVAVDGSGETRIKQTVYAWYEDDTLSKLYEPEIHLTDLTGDGRPDVVVSFTTMRYSKGHEETVRVFDGATLKEYEVEPWSDAVSRMIPEKTDEEKKESLFLITDNAEITAEKSSFLYREDYYNEFCLEQDYSYDASFGRLSCVSLICGTYYEYVGRAYVYYKLENGRFVYDCSIFRPFGNDSFFDDAMIGAELMLTESEKADLAAMRWDEAYLISRDEEFEYFTPVPADRIVDHYRDGTTNTLEFDGMAQKPRDKAALSFLDHYVARNIANGECWLHSLGRHVKVELTGEGDDLAVTVPDPVPADPEKVAWSLLYNAYEQDQTDVSLFRIDVDDQRYITVRAGYFRWDPEIKIVELTGDGYPEIVFTSPENHGTGVYEEDIHVFDGKTLVEIDVENAVETIRGLVTFTRTDIDGDPANGCVFEINGKKAATSDELIGALYSEREPTDEERANHLKEYADSVPTLGDFYKYEIKDGKLTCGVPLAYDRYLNYYGSFEVTFLYNKEKGLTVDGVDYGTENVSITIKETAAVIAAREEARRKAEEAARLEAKRKAEEEAARLEATPKYYVDDDLAYRLFEADRKRNEQWMKDHGFYGYTNMTCDGTVLQGHMGYDKNGVYGWVGPGCP